MTETNNYYMRGDHQNEGVNFEREPMDDVAGGWHWDSVLIAVVLSMIVLAMLALIHTLLAYLLKKVTSPSSKKVSPVPPEEKQTSSVGMDKTLMANMLKNVLTDAIYISKMEDLHDRTLALSKNARLEYAIMRNATMATEETRKNMERESNATYAYIHLYGSVSPYENDINCDTILNDMASLLNFCSMLTVGEKIMISENVDRDEMTFPTERKALKYVKQVLSRIDNDLGIARNLTDPNLESALKEIAEKLIVSA